MPRQGTTAQSNCFTCQTRKRAEWCILGEEDLALLDSTKKSREHLPGELIFHQGEACAGVYCIESGLIGVRRFDAQGNSILLRLAYPGDTLGYRSVLIEEKHRVGAEVLQGARICFIDRTAVRTLIGRNPALGLRFLKRATRELDAAEEKIFSDATMSMRVRLIHFLLVLKDRFATTANSCAFTLELPLSRQDLAAMIGARPESMSRTIKSLEDDGIARFSGRTVHVPRLDSLLDEIELGEDQ